MALPHVPNVPRPTVQFIRTPEGSTACNRCGCTVDAQFHQLHRKWHQDNDK